MRREWIEKSETATRGQAQTMHRMRLRVRTPNVAIGADGALSIHRLEGNGAVAGGTKFVHPVPFLFMIDPHCG